MQDSVQVLTESLRSGRTYAFGTAPAVSVDGVTAAQQRTLLPLALGDAVLSRERSVTAGCS